MMGWVAAFDPERTVAVCEGALMQLHGIRPPGCSAAFMSPGPGCARASSLTSLRRAPHRPDPPPLWRCTRAARHGWWWAEGVGWGAERSKGGAVGRQAGGGGHERSPPPCGLGPGHERTSATVRNVPQAALTLPAFGPRTICLP